MPRLTRRTALLLTSYLALLLATIMAGFLATAVGVWAAILWGVVVVAAVAWFGRQRLSHRRDP
jgi:hypothetical protein